MVKGYVAKRNGGSGLSQILTLCKEGIASITPEMWKNCVLHAIKYENIMWERDRLIDDNVSELYADHKKIIIPLGEDDSSDETTSGSESDFSEPEDNSFEEDTFCVNNNRPDDDSDKENF